jgi:23S rRNA (uracil1939-C5)-methyltransferase
MGELAFSGEKFDVVIMDPPRAGSTQEFISAVAAVSPEKVVYVSCKIESLERDMKLFRKLGYKAQLIQPVDMFAHTVHIETVVLMTRADKYND